ncbi:hypothetical protein KP509_15G062900 [Ceratopteris richardii]|uniref:Homeobox domain-containing protein n=1 Tax=Ceratopteris richardii TaxID=49495 RepID=A0A8T2T8Z9_CERRI|nr:hypothetical protein KP509_15G062900 [Ceratopteris richardii]
MQITDNREHILLGVQTLRAMATAACRTSSSPSVELSIFGCISNSISSSGNGMDNRTANRSEPSEDLNLVLSSSGPKPLIESTLESPPKQLDLLPVRSPCQKPAEGYSRWNAISDAHVNSKGIDMNQIPCSSESEDEDEAEAPSLKLRSLAGEGKRSEMAALGSGMADPGERERGLLEVSSRNSDEEESGSARKKLRLSKEQSALLEESFKEHSTLNPKQKSLLAKQLNLRPRQVEVWFQNRRARTKLKQTEVDCELLKRCCESLTEENRRLQKEVAELRALKVGAPCVISRDFCMPLPAATLTMCPSCERLAHGQPPSTSASITTTNAVGLSFSNKPGSIRPALPSPSAAC